MRLINDLQQAKDKHSTFLSVLSWVLGSISFTTWLIIGLITYVAYRRLVVPSMGRQPSSYVNVSVSPSTNEEETQRKSTARRAHFSDLRQPSTEEILREEQHNGTVPTDDNKILRYLPVVV